MAHLGPLATSGPPYPGCTGQYLDPGPVVSESHAMVEWTDKPPDTRLGWWETVSAWPGKARGAVMRLPGAMIRWLGGPRHRGWKILATVVVGCGGVGLLLWCGVSGLATSTADVVGPDGAAVRRGLSAALWTMMTNRPPWQVAASLIVAPVLMLTWYWRTLARGEELRIALESQVTDRFVAAVTLLSEAGKEAAQIGGIYALERIAVDSERDLESVIDTLAAFVDASVGTDDDDNLPRPKQIAVDVLGRLGVRNVKRRGKDLRGARLQYADLHGAHLEDHDLTGAHLTGASLNGAYLNRAHLNGAHLNGAHLNGTRLNMAHLNGAHLIGAHLIGAPLNWAHLMGANLTGANLTGAHLTGAHLTGANLHKANLTGANLTAANLSGAAHLNGANLTDAINLTQDQINIALGDNRTGLPSHIKRPDHWTVYIPPDEDEESEQEPSKPPPES